MANPAAALGQEIGKLFEDSIVSRLRPEVETMGHSIAPAQMKNGTDNIYQIDAVISNEHGQPVMILDPKYIRYKKHNRDKGSWLCVAHYNLRKSHPSIRKTTAVLAGNWSHTSIALIKSFGIEVITVEFQKMVDVLKGFGVQFDWDEKDRITPLRALANFHKLKEQQRKSLARDLTDEVIEIVTDSVVNVLATDMSTIKSRVSDVEVVVKTDQQEMLVMKFGNIADSVAGLIKFMEDRTDVRDLLHK